MSDALYIEDNYGNLVGVGDIIVYGSCQSSSAALCRAEVLEITKAREKRTTTFGNYTFWSDYKMKVRAEENDRASSLTRAPFVLVASKITLDDYIAQIKTKYGMEEPDAQDHPRTPAADPQG